MEESKGKQELPSPGPLKQKNEGRRNVGYEEIKKEGEGGGKGEDS